MPLHRDIHWIGRQWAVTGHGMQLIDQKLQGFFDVEVSRLWDDDLIEALHAKEWLNIADFDKGLAIARARYPQPSGAVTQPREVAPPLAIKPVAPIAEVAKPIAPKPEAPRVETPRVETPKPEKPNPIEPPRAATDVTKGIAVMPARDESSPSAVTPASPSLPPIPRREEPKPEAPQAVAELQAPAIATPIPVEPPNPPPTLFQMRYEGRARFVRPWRVVARRKT
jgi:hypothetical protein